MHSQWTAREIMRLVLRRKFLVAGITLALLFTAVTITFFLPRKYESFTRVRVVDQQALRDLYGLKLDEEGESPGRALLITDEFRSEEAVTAVISHLELDRHLKDLPETEQERGRDALIREIQSSTRVGILKTEPGQFIFRVGISSQDPERAQRIATCLTTSFQPLLDGERQETETGTPPDTRRSMVEIVREHRAVAEELAKFEEEHADLVSGQKETIDVAHQQEYERLRTVEDEIPALLRRLETIRAQLAEEPEWLTAADANDRVPNRTYAELKKSEQQAAGELKISEQKREDLLARVELIDRKQEALPLLLAQREALRERRDNLQRDLQEREEQEEAAKDERLAQRAENALIFEVLDPPTYPDKPDLPNQLAIALMGLVLGLGAGTGTVLLLDLSNHSFRSAREIPEFLEIPVLGTIARIETPAQRIKARRKARLAAVAITALFFLTATALFVQVSSDGDVGPLMARVLKMFG